MKNDITTNVFRIHDDLCPMAKAIGSCDSCDISNFRGLSEAHSKQRQVSMMELFYENS